MYDQGTDLLLPPHMKVLSSIIFFLLLLRSTYEIPVSIYSLIQNKGASNIGRKRERINLYLKRLSQKYRVSFRKK